MNHPRTWSTRRRTALAAAALAAVAAVAVPSVALASSPSATSSTSSTAAPAASSCTPTQRLDALAVAAPKIAGYLDAHPDLGTELQTLKALPKDQRAAAAKTYFTAHPDERAALRDARAGLRTFHTTCHA